MLLAQKILQKVEKLPESVQAEILAVGPGGRDGQGRRLEIDVLVGGTVLIGKWAGTEVKLDGVEVLVLKESDIIGVVEKKSGKKAA